MFASIQQYSYEKRERGLSLKISCNCVFDPIQHTEGSFSGLESKGSTVHTVSLTSRSWPIRKDVAQMRVAPRAKDFGPFHHKSDV